MSSVMVFCRAMVMLACLLAIPLLAMFYGDLPESVRKTVSRGRSFLAARLSDDPGEPQAGTPLPSVSVEALPAEVETPAPSRPAAAEVAEIPREPLPQPFAQPTPVYEPDSRNPPASSPAGRSNSSVAANQVRFEEDASSKLPPGGSAADAAEQLQALGAVDYMLERWGNDGMLYRFHCKMPIAGSARVCRHFEAFDSSPADAVAEVVLAVKAWQQDRQ